MSDTFSPIDGFLIDIDGVLTIGSEVIPGALEAIQSLRARDDFPTDYHQHNHLLPPDHVGSAACYGLSHG
ncbi:MAG: hypothetical protein HC802_08225 [Caldilineaceae bacterium]|nr:hypothetical protein [Caldilineaceae bacterium]